MLSIHALAVQYIVFIPHWQFFDFRKAEILLVIWVFGMEIAYLQSMDCQREPQSKHRYYDQAPAMIWDHAVSWGRGVWVSVSDIGRVGLGRVGQPESKK